MDINKQKYVSNELTHFVGRKSKTDEERYAVLAKILTDGQLTYDPNKPRHAGISTYGIGGSISVDFSTNEMYLPTMVCFCDIPINDLSIHMQKYGNFGISFNKDFIVKKGGRPVFYIPKRAVSRISDFQDVAQYFTPKIRDYQNLFECLRTTSPVDLPLNIQTLMSENPNIIEGLKLFFDYSIFCYIQCFDHTLNDEDANNYYFEREWRVVGDVDFTLDDVKRVFIPESYEVKIRQEFPNYKGLFKSTDS